MAQTNCTSELTFLCFFFSRPPSALLSLLSSSPDHQGVSPQDAGAESRSHCNCCQLPGFIQHSWSGGQYHNTQRRAHTHTHIPSFPPSKAPMLLSKSSRRASEHTGSRGGEGPLSLVVPPPVKLRDADEHWGARIDSSICSSWGVGPPLSSGPRARIS